eukprot:CAMPEP_0169062758 /NCGR_PEP_ID=MMETSP1015-20121227/878_1 /TAXON_ID=342587 /ORGANISM="Karlodinium micrum, Strain CCMP2283" /LENGTH=101 /DNA_ID=CAMNT_0009120961 /DNA_START=604 /DNA_END=909 /DNA_ORIENTATION=+
MTRKGQDRAMPKELANNENMLLGNSVRTNGRKATAVKLGIAPITVDGVIPLTDNMALNAKTRKHTDSVRYTIWLNQQSLSLPHSLMPKDGTQLNQALGSAE